MTLDSLVSQLHLAGVAKGSKKNTLRTLNAVFGLIADDVQHGGKFRMPRFGTFSRGRRSARRIKLVNGQIVTLPEVTVPRFVPAESFRAAVRGSVSKSVAA